MIEDNTFTLQHDQREYQTKIPNDIIVRDGRIYITNGQTNLVLHLTNGEILAVPVDDLSYCAAPDIDDEFEVSEEDYMRVLSG